MAGLRDIPALVTLLGGDATVIQGYEDEHPGSVSVQTAISQVPTPGILVVWNGTSPSGGRSEQWTHRFQLVLKTDNKYMELFEAIVNGIRAGRTRRWRLENVTAECGPIATFSCDRRTLLVSEQPLSLIDYFDVSFSVSDRGISL